MFIQCLLKHILDLFINQSLKNTDWALPVWRVMSQSWGLKVERKVWPSRTDHHYQLQQNKGRFWVGRCVWCLRVRVATCQGNAKGTRKTPGKSDRSKDAQTPGESGRGRKQSSRWGKPNAARETREARFVEAVKWLRMAGGSPASEKMTALKMCWDVDYWTETVGFKSKPFLLQEM